jgi:hypothetical protein
MELGLLLATFILLVCAGVAAVMYSRTEHCFFALREARRQIRRLGYRRRRQWHY